MKKLFVSALCAASLLGCSNPSDKAAEQSTGMLGTSADVATSSGGSKASCSTRAYEEIGGPISLIDQTGTRRTEADFSGKPALVFFGFIYCPDVCPTTLVKIDRALQRLDKADRPTPVFITVDPERDTPEAMSNYLSLEAYPDTTIGLTGTEDEIKAAAKAFIATYQRVPLPDSTAEYTMDHTSLIYLMDENWNLKSFFDYTASDADIATCIEELF